MQVPPLYLIAKMVEKKRDTLYPEPQSIQNIENKRANNKFDA